MNRTHLLRGLLTASLLLVPAVRAQDAAPPPSLGFATASRAAQAAAEAKALAVPTPDRARTWLRALTEEPHVAGTKADYDTAVYLRDRLREWGWTADLAEYEVLLDYPYLQTLGTPVIPRLEIIRPNPQRLKLIEDPHGPDKDSAAPGAWPAWHGYGASGIATGQVVYANFGRPEDFDALDRLGVSVKDKIVLTRYGGCFRGLKVWQAQRRGAIGVLIFSDPADDGFGRGDVYPIGPYRPPSAIQRGSVQFLSRGPGDPSTPGTPSLPGAKRLPWDPRNGFPLLSGSNPLMQRPFIVGIQNPDGESVNITIPSVEEWEKLAGRERTEAFAAIPSLPISYEAAAPILQAMGGPNVPSGWQGGLPLAYHVGPGPVEVTFETRHEYRIRKIWNVIATLRGTVEPDRWVMIGNHRDAWTYGAVDPSSGTAATMETCRALGEAVKNGWKPRRTLVYASWDAEEYGLVGSTEYAEHHADELKQKAVLMLNVDVAVGGSDLSLDGIPSLRDLMLQCAGQINDPKSGRSLADLWLAKRKSAWASGPFALDDSPWTGAAPATPSDPFTPHMGWMGSGSDYTAFVDHLGIPALDVGFGGHYGVYHSIYDNFFWMEKFGDPEFLYHATAARLFTLVAMRAAAADVAPLTFVPYGEALRDHVDDLRRTLARKVRGGATPKVSDMLFAPVIAGVKNFRAQAEACDRATAALTAGKEPIDPALLSALNDALMNVERAFLAPEGLPDRPWYRHVIYAPGLTTGYAAWPLPGIYQAVGEDDPKMFQEQAALLARQLDAAASVLADAARKAGGAAR
jgi:N-acetylated-alpha-linked acidic dipeptidase